MQHQKTKRKIQKRRTKKSTASKKDPYGYQPDSPLTQHYLTTGSYPGLHRQYLFVNLNKWVELGQPDFDEIGVYQSRKPMLSNFEYSEETVHSDYTPAWIKSAEGQQEYSTTADGRGAENS